MELKDIIVFFHSGHSLWFYTVIILVISYIYFLKNPNQWLIFASKIYAFFSIFKKNLSKKVVSLDIEGRINSFTDILRKEAPNEELPKAKVVWINEDQKPDSFIQKGKLIIRMHQHYNQNKNLVSASMIFIANSILKKTKIYLAKYQKESLDLFIGKKLFEKIKPSVLEDQFFKDFFIKELSDSRINDLVRKYNLIDKFGLFYPVFIQELNFLGIKCFENIINNKQFIIIEANSLIDFLHKFSTRVEGETTKNIFEGKFCRCSITIISTAEDRVLEKKQKYIRHIKSLINKKIENIYILGPNIEENKKFVDSICNTIIKNYNYGIYLNKVFKGEILIKTNERRGVETYLVVLRCNDILKYIDEEYENLYIRT
jgi:hypothetical protein